MYLVNTPDGTFFSYYEKPMHFFPFTFNIQCTTPGYLLISGKKSSYLLNQEEMRKVLTRLMKETPELFKKED